MTKKSSSWGSKALTGAKVLGGSLGTGAGIDFILNVLQNLPAGKDGGRVTPKGIGKATHGYGKAMKRKK